ncbi:MAG: rRNA maturation RNase YbeY [Bacteroidetes bacterium]|nr:rRNA maturation RNase YbeY [Bacteroidota bacterium]
MINFVSEDIVFNLKNKTILKKWITATIEKKKRKTGDISFVFCSDAFLLEMNKEYLNHDTYTDIITFDYSEDIPFDSAKGDDSKGSKNRGNISGDIFISIDMVKENAKKFSPFDSAQGDKQRKKNFNFEDELHRVIIHGVLHLLGYKDKSKVAKAEMTKQEDLCLKALQKI